MIQESRENKPGKGNAGEAIHKLVLTYATSKQIFSQEAISHCLLVLWQEKSFSYTFLLYTNIPFK